MAKHSEVSDTKAKDVDFISELEHKAIHTARFGELLLKLYKYSKIYTTKTLQGIGYKNRQP